MDLDEPNFDDPAIDDLLRRIGPHPSRADHAWLMSTETQRLARTLGVDLSPVLEARREALQGVLDLLRATVHLGRLGWVVAAHRLPSEAYAEAADLIDAGADAEVVDAHMARAWAEDDGVALRGSYGWLHHLYGPDDASIDLMFGRVTLLDQALEHHCRGEYAASILIILSQIDGIVLDATGGAYGFFVNARGGSFEDLETIAGLPGNLRSVWKDVIRDSNTTTLEGRFRRSAIVHGRELGFGTEVNSTKAFALLSSVIEWLHGRGSGE